jgi:hypothetical protein
MAKKVNGAETSTSDSQASNGGLREKLENKTEAVQRALDELGWDAKPLEIQDHVKKYYDVDVSTKVISVYKGKLSRGRRRGKRGRRAKVEATAVPVPVPARAPRTGGRDAPIDVGVLKALKELSERVGAGRFRELVELMVP